MTRQASPVDGGLLPCPFCGAIPKPPRHPTRRNRSMTITIGFWFWPVALFIAGLVVALIGFINDDSPSYGFGNGCLGMVICVGCWAVAAGLAIGRYFA